MFLGFKRDTFFTRTFQSRKIGNVGAVSDRDADRFIFTAGITDEAERTAIYYLVHMLKLNGIWSKMRTIHPMVGGTASSCSFNLVNPSSNQITWINSPTFSSTGVLGNGVNQYGTITIPIFTANDFSVSSYVRNNGVGVILGNANASIGLTPRIAGNTLISGNTTLFTGATLNYGLFLGTKNASFVRNFHNGAFCLQAASSTATTGLGFNVLANAGSGTPGSFSTQELALFHTGTALSDAEVAIFYSIIQQFQTILSRQV